MRKDIDVLMEERDVDWLLVLGERYANKDFIYLTNGVMVTGGPLVKRRGEQPILLYRPMEKEEAEKSGCRLLDMINLGLREIHKSAGTPYQASLKFYQRLIEHLNVQGNVALYGKAPVRWIYHQWQQLLRDFPQINLVMEEKEDILTKARQTKDEGEIERIREVGEKAIGVMKAVFDFLRSCRSQNGTVISGKEAVSIGKIKELIRLEMAKNGLEETMGTVFAQGTDAGYPHSMGKEDEQLRVGKPIVFDFFPSEATGGYVFDITRTLCISEAPPEVEKAYEQVKEAQRIGISAVKVGEPVSKPHEQVCDYFEAQGHPTPRSDEKTTIGYCHSLGHGIGLDIHEAPSIFTAKYIDQLFQPGMVFTIEPGLYYPEKGYGVRLEDVVAIHQDGTVENLTKFEKELVLKLST